MRVTSCFILLLLMSLSHAETLIIGTADFNPPFVMASGFEKKYSGFDAAIINEICQRMAVKCVFKALSFGNFFKSVDNGSIDLAIGGITISLDRDKQYDFSLPYLQSYGQYLINASSSIRSINALSGKIVGVPADSVYINMIIESFGNDAKINTYNNYPQMMEALSNNSVDALALDQAAANYWISNDCPHCKLLGDPFPYGYGYGILAAKNKDDLIARVNKALLSMQSDGAYLKIYKTYF